MNSSVCFLAVPRAVDDAGPDGRACEDEDD
jgi:hypothetical protein